MPVTRRRFVRDGRLTVDIGWVGAVSSKRKINDGKWHDIAMTYDTYPFPLQQLSGDITADCYTSNFLDFATRNRLPVGD